MASASAIRASLPPCINNLPIFDHDEDSSPRSETSADTSDGEGDSDGEEHPLDQDIYGAAIYTMIHDGESIVTWSEQDVLDRRTNLVQILFVMMALLVNFTLQFLVLGSSFGMVINPLKRHIREVYSKFRSECFPAGAFPAFNWTSWADYPNKDGLCNIALTKTDFLAAILWIWTLTMFEEMKKIEHQARVLLSIRPTSNPYKMVSRDEDTGVFRIKRITPCLRAALICTVVVPKIMIVVFLTIAGFVWLTATDLFADLILNAVALGFVIHIDEQIYLALLPNSVKAQMARTVLWSPRPPEKTAKESEDEICNELMRSFFYLVSSVAIVAIYLGPGQWLFPILPGFNGDIDLLCKERRAVRKPMCIDDSDCFPVG